MAARKSGPNPQALIGAVAAQTGARYGPARCTLKNYRCKYKGQPEAIARLSAVASSIADFVRDGRGLILMGSVGTGKDHLLAAMLFAAAGAGIVAGWTNGQEFFGRFRDRIDSGQTDEGEIAALCRLGVLGISDPIPPVGSIGGWDATNLYRLVDRRYRALRPTWITLNASDAEEADRMLSEPVFDRLRDSAEVIECFWPSYRQRAS